MSHKQVRFTWAKMQVAAITQRGDWQAAVACRESREIHTAAFFLADETPSSLLHRMRRCQLLQAKQRRITLSTRTNIGRTASLIR